MLGMQFPIHFHICARSAEVGRRSRTASQPPQKLHLDRDREVLRFEHALVRLRMNHNPAIARCPGRALWSLLSEKAIFDDSNVMRKFLAIEDMSKPVAEFVVLIVRNFQYTILYAKGITEVIIEIVTG